MATATTAELAIVKHERAIDLIRAELDKRERDLLAVLPPGMDAQRFMRVSLLAISKNPDLLECTPGSIIRSIVEAAEVGLEPTGSLNRAWLVPYKDKDSGKKEAQLMIGYQGYADLMRDSGKVTRITTEVVYEGDEFRVVKGTDNPRIEHEPKFKTEDPSKITHVYAVAWFADGEYQSEVMTRDQVELVRAKSRQRNGPTWTQGWPQMARKTAIRRLQNYVPLSLRAQQAIARDDEREFGRPDDAPRVSRTAEVRALLDERPKRGRRAKPAEDAPGAAEPAPQPDSAAPDASAAQQTAAEPTDVEDGVVSEVCGSTSDPALGSVESCVLPVGHLEGDPKPPQRHQAESGSIWPAAKP